MELDAQVSTASVVAAAPRIAAWILIVTTQSSDETAIDLIVNVLLQV
jgi:hypothetical protein